MAELCWYLSGSDNVEPVEFYMQGYAENAEEDGRVHGAYGPRLFGTKPNNQVDRVIDLLRSASATRRAVIQLFDRHDLGPPRYQDVPCTCTLQFLVRDDHLDLVVTMRSNDVYKGLPHDVFAFTMLQELVARSVEVEPGRYIHFVGSLHRYDDDLDDLRAFLAEGYQATAPTMPPMPIGDPWEQVRALVEAERQLRAGVPYPEVTLPSDPYWADLVRLLAHWIEVKKNVDRSAADAIVDQLTHDGYRAFL